MKEMSVSGQKRATTGKKAAKELRKEGLVPCNLYGEKKDEKGLPEALSFAIPATQLRKVVYSPDVYVVNVTIDGETHKAVMKEIQFHPTTDAVLHIDFFEVNETKPITIGIPVKLTGHAQGVRDGGRLSQAVRTLNVTAPYKQIPEVLNVDVTELKLGKAIKVAELNFEGLEIATPAQVVVCSVKATRASRSAAAAGEEAAAEGFMVLDAFAKASNIHFEDRRYGFVAETTVKGRKVFLLKPSTFMNLSGNAVRYWLNKENIDQKRLLVISDDVALPLGAFRLKANGSNGGHNGLGHIQQLIGQDYARLRMGIGSDFPHGMQVDWVLGKYDEEDLKVLQPSIDLGVEIIKSFVLAGIDITMNQYNKLGKAKKVKTEDGGSSKD